MEQAQTKKDATHQTMKLSTIGLFGSILVAAVATRTAASRSTLFGMVPGRHHHHSKTLFPCVNDPHSKKVPTTTTAILSLRGGAGPIDPNTMCKVSVVACLLQGLMATLGPKQSNEQYGILPEFNDDIQYLHMKNLGTGILSIGVMLYTVSEVTSAFYLFEKIMMKRFYSCDCLSFSIFWGVSLAFLKHAKYFNSYCF